MINRQILFVDCRPILQADKTNVVLEINETAQITLGATESAECTNLYSPGPSPPKQYSTTIPTGFPGQLVDNVFTISPTLKAEIGTYKLDFKASIQNLPQIESAQTLAISVEIKSCSVLTDLQPPVKNDPIEVKIGVETLIPVANVQLPDCGVQLTNTLEAASNAVPTFVTVEAGNKIKVYLKDAT